MRFIPPIAIALALFVAPASAEPNGLRINPSIILEPIASVSLSEAFHTPEFVQGEDGVIGLWRFSYEEGLIDGDWQAIGLIAVSTLGEGVEPVAARVWARGEITSGDSSGLTAAAISPPTGSITAFRVQLTRTRGTATITLDGNGLVQVNNQRLGVTGP